MKLSIFTLTGMRPQAFALCHSYLKRQTIFSSTAYLTGKLEVEWILVDDGEPKTEIPYMHEGMTTKIIHPTPSWQPGQNTFKRNLLAALEQLSENSDVVAFFEDDDVQSSDYLQWIVEQHTTDNMILGESFSKYYNLHWRKSNERDYKTYASFSQTSFSSGLIPYLLWILDAHKDNHDMYFWKEAPEETFLSLIAPIFPHVIGMKGMPGRTGIGRGHKKIEQQTWIKDDKNYSTLINYLGIEDAEPYIEIMEDYKRQESISQK